jgi:ATP-dependent RNA helicase RhlE
VVQSIVHTTPGQKNSVLMDELNARQGSVLIFARTQIRTDRVARFLAESGHQVSRIHGGRTQGQRNAALSGFRDGKVRILVATDIAARGIDISHIAQALSLLTSEDKQNWRDISRLLAKVQPPKVDFKVAH